MKKITIFLGVSAIFFSFLPISTFAAEFLEADSVLGGISSNIRDDVYTLGNQISTLPQSSISGDLIIAGGQINISGPISQDLTAVAGTLSIDTNIGDDVRVATGNFSLNGIVRGDVMVATGQGSILSETQIVGETYITGGQLQLLGSYTGDVEVIGGEILFDGSTAGNVILKGEDITIGQNAIIAGDLSYPKGSKITISDKADIRGEILDAKYNKSNHRSAILGIIAMMQFVKMIGLMIVAILLVLVFPKISRKITNATLTSPGKKLLIGLGWIVIVPIVGLMVMATLIGIPLAMLIFSLYFFVIMLGGVYAGVTLGSWLQDKFGKGKNLYWAWSLLGVLILFLLLLIPIIGWIVLIAVSWSSIGGVVSLLHKRIWNKRN